MPFDGGSLPQVAQTLIEGRARVARAWSQGRGRGPGGAVCAALAVGCDPEAMTLLIKAIGCRCLPFWNDAPERTQAEVLAAFDCALALVMP